MSSYFKEGELNSDGTASQTSNPIAKIGIYWEVLNDKIKNYYMYRWITIIFLLLFFIIRLIMTKGIN